MCMNMDMETANKNLREKLLFIYRRKLPPPVDSYLKVLDNVNGILESEDPLIRPPDIRGLPGGLIILRQNIPTIIVPDLHARQDLFLSLLLWKENEGASVLEKLEHGKIQIVCAGDGFHAEGRAADRWAFSFEEYTEGYKEHTSMDMEMRESLGVMEMVMEVKSSFPSFFHFLKGNHENITNEEGNGNHSFRKYSYEGEMVVYYIEKFYGQEFLSNYYRFEKNLPLFAVGRNFLVSHAEPSRFLEKEEIINYRTTPDLVEALTWTSNGEAEEGSVKQMIEYYLDPEEWEKGYYFGGHRPVRGKYNLRAEGKYVQIHNPDRFTLVLINETGNIDLERDLLEIENFF